MTHAIIRGKNGRRHPLPLEMPLVILGEKIRLIELGGRR